MNFIRHYEMSDGTYAASNFGDFGKVIVGHAHETDPRMILVKFDRNDDKKDILLVNWQAHADHGTANGRTNISADFPGALRDKLQEESGCLVAYFTGADGNTNIDSRVEADKHNLNWREYGVKMATLAYEAYQELQEVEGSGIAYKRAMFDAEVDHSWDHMLAEANEVFDLWKSTDKKTGDALGKQYNFTSVYQARAIRSRAAMGKTRPLELNAFRVGGIGFTTGTYEMFSESGIFIKENSPYTFTFLLTGNSGYIPSEKAFGYRCYEADTGFFAKGTAEKLADKYVEMLKEHH
jgi:hypothetical protein